MKSCLIKHKARVLREAVNNKMTQVLNDMMESKDNLYHVMVLRKDADAFRNIVIPFNDMLCFCKHSNKDHCHYIGVFNGKRRNISTAARKANVTPRGYQAKLLRNDQHKMATLGYIQTKELFKGKHYHEEHTDELHTFKSSGERNLWFKKMSVQYPHIHKIYLEFVKEKEEKKILKRRYFENKYENINNYFDSKYDAFGNPEYKPVFDLIAGESVESARKRFRAFEEGEDKANDENKQDYNKDESDKETDYSSEEELSDSESIIEKISEENLIDPSEING
jgi:hypothetical protein